MRMLRLLDTDSALVKAQGSSVPAWAAARLAAVGFDLTEEIIYRYEPLTFSTVFMQYQSPAERRGDPVQTHVDSDYSEEAVWTAAVEELARMCEEEE